MTFTRSHTAEGTTVLSNVSDPIRELENRLRLSTDGRYHSDLSVISSPAATTCEAHHTYDALSEDVFKYERHLASGDLHAEDVLRLAQAIGSLRSATLPGQLTSRKRNSKRSDLGVPTGSDSDSLLSMRTLATDTLTRALVRSVVELLQVFSLADNGHDAWWPPRSTPTTADATTCHLSERMQEVIMARHDELATRFKTLSCGNAAVATRVVVRRELVVVQCLAVAIGRIRLADYVVSLIVSSCIVAAN